MLFNSYCCISPKQQSFLNQLLMETFINSPFKNPSTTPITHWDSFPYLNANCLSWGTNSIILLHGASQDSLMNQSFHCVLHDLEAREGLYLVTFEILQGPRTSARKIQAKGRIEPKVPVSASYVTAKRDWTGLTFIPQLLVFFWGLLHSVLKRQEEPVFHSITIIIFSFFFCWGF